MARQSRAYDCLIDRVIDGDTVVLKIDLGFKVWLHDVKIRLVGINTPELNSSDQAVAAKARAARDAAQAFLGQQPKWVLLSYGDPDKYGRWLGDLVDSEGLRLTTHLLTLGLAEIYKG